MPISRIGNVIKSQRFKETLTVYRKTGSWVAGRWIQTEDPISVLGVVTSPGTNDIIQVPEADRTSEIMCFHTLDKLHVTHAKDSEMDGGTSDEILWNDKRYRLYQVKNWSHYGYYKSIGISMEGD